MAFEEDTSYNDLREKSIRLWLQDMSKHQDITVRGGVYVTEEYLNQLKKQITELKEKNAMKDAYLKKLKQERYKD